MRFHLHSAGPVFRRASKFNSSGASKTGVPPVFTPPLTLQRGCEKNRKANRRPPPVACQCLARIAHSAFAHPAWRRNDEERVRSGPKGGGIAADFLALLVAVMVRLAQALKRAVKEQVCIAAMRHDVVDDPTTHTLQIMRERVAESGMGRGCVKTNFEVQRRKIDSRSLRSQQ